MYYYMYTESVIYLYNIYIYIIKLFSLPRVPQVLTTACSGSGAPTLALKEIVGATNIREIAAAEKHAA